MSNASTIKYSSGAGVDWAALLAGLGLGLTVAMQVTTMTSGKVSASDCPEMYTTIASGISPIKKLTRPAKATEIGKICGGT